MPNNKARRKKLQFKTVEPEPLSEWKGIPIQLISGTSTWKGKPEELADVMDRLKDEGTPSYSLYRGDAIMLAKHYPPTPPVPPIELSVLSSENQLVVRELGELANG